MSNFNFNNNTNVEIKAMGKLAEGYTVIPNNIMNDIVNMKADGFTIFAKILQYINSSKNKISVAGLSKLTGLTKGRVSKGLNKLIELGYIKRRTKFNGNIKNGYIYEVYGERQINEEDSREHVGNSRRTENWDIGNEYTEITDNKKEKEKKEKEKKENVVVDVDTKTEEHGIKSNGINADEKLIKENMIIETYKTYNIQPRVMPQMKKLLLAYSNEMDLELYEEIFMLASEDKIKSKYKYIKELLEKFDSKGIHTLKSYELDCKKFKEDKQVNSSKDKSKAFKGQKNGSEGKKVVTRFHNINTSFDKYGENELEEVLATSQYYNHGYELEIKKLYIRAINNGLGILLTEEGKKAVVDFATKNNMEIPK